MTEAHVPLVEYFAGNQGRGILEGGKERVFPHFVIKIINRYRAESVRRGGEPMMYGRDE